MRQALNENQGIRTYHIDPGPIVNRVLEILEQKPEVLLD